MPCFGFVPNPKFTEFWLDVFGPNKNIDTGDDFWEKSLESMDLSKLYHLIIVEKVQSTTSALCKKIL